MTTIKEGLHYVRLQNGEYVSAGKARSNPEMLLNLPPRLCAEKPESNERHSRKDKCLDPSKEGVRYRIIFTVFRRRLLDNHDNARSALKPLCDLVCLSLGFDDDSAEALQFEYNQLKTTGPCGTHVLIHEIITPTKHLRSHPK